MEDGARKFSKYSIVGLIITIVNIIGGYLLLSNLDSVGMTLFTIPLLLIAGVVVNILAIFDCSRNNRRGKILSITGLLIGIVPLVMTILVVLLAFGAGRY